MRLPYPWIVLALASSSACSLEHPIYNPGVDAAGDLPTLDVSDAMDVNLPDVPDASDVADGADVSDAVADTPDGVSTDVSDVTTVDTPDGASCGALGQPCCTGGALTPCALSGLACVAGVCTAVLPCDGGPLTFCSGVCVDTTTSLDNCGSCGHACPPAASNTTASCAAGTCSANCNTGFGDCNHVASDGCEATLATDLANCGSCGHGCVAPAHGVANCAAGSCASTCDPGYALTGGVCVSIAAPRLLAPLSTASTTSQRPSLHWSLAAGTNGARVDICRDRACTMVATSYTVTGTHGAPTVTLTPGVYFWRAVGAVGAALGSVYSPTWEFVVGAHNAAVDASGGTFVDDNGDGYADVVAGAYSTTTFTYFHGGPTGVSATAAGTRSPTGSPSSGQGYVTSAGDVNGDGYADVLLGVPSASAVYVYFGGASGLAATAANILTGTGYGVAMAGGGDVNGDGYADVIVGVASAGTATVFLGSAAGLQSTPLVVLTGASGSSFGVSVADDGDINGDGYADVVVGASLADRVVLFTGGPTGPSAGSAVTLVGAAIGSRFGIAVADGGDVNGDGYADVVVGAYNYSSTAGSVTVYPGGATGLGAALPTLYGTTGTGIVLSTSGDINGDGLADIVAGTTHDQVFVEYGSFGTLSATPTYIADPTGTTGSSFGYAVALLGDTNRDGYGDLGAGALIVGQVLVFHGASGGITGAPAETLTAPGSTQFGLSVASRWTPGLHPRRGHGVRSTMRTVRPRG